MLALDFLNAIKDGNVRQQFVSLAEQLRAWGLQEHDEEGHHQSVAPTGTIEVGDIITSGSPVTRTRALLCDGRELNRVKYALLFSRYGTTHGAGDGSTTFNLPDYRDRFLVGVGSQAGALGATGGDFDHVHTLGAHTHDITAVGNHNHAVSGSAVSPASAWETFELIFSTGAPGASRDHSHDVTGGTDDQGGHDHGGVTGAASGGDTGASNPPYAAVYYYVYTGVLEL